jgi:hypothetical protein
MLTRPDQVPNGKTLRALAPVLGVTVEWLLGETDDIDLQYSESVIRQVVRAAQADGLLDDLSPEEAAEVVLDAAESLQSIPSTGRSGDTANAVIRSIRIRRRRAS